MTTHQARGLLEFFDHGHLPEGLMRDSSHECFILANDMVDTLEHTEAGAELTTGIRKLLEAKDCFVRAAMKVPDQRVDDQ